MNFAQAEMRAAVSRASVAGRRRAPARDAGIGAALRPRSFVEWAALRSDVRLKAIIQGADKESLIFLPAAEQVGGENISTRNGLLSDARRLLTFTAMLFRQGCAAMPMMMHQRQRVSLSLNSKKCSSRANVMTVRNWSVLGACWQTGWR